METIFTLSSLLVAPFWFLMIVLPQWRWTRRIVASPLVVAPPAVLYLVLALPQLGTLLRVLLTPTLPAVMALLGSEAGATLGWAHYLAFDLFVGRWVYLDSQARGSSAWLLAPVLFLTLMVGPIGLLAYLGLRSAATRNRTAA